jgi:hypothetical protein
MIENIDLKLTGRNASKIYLNFVSIIEQINKMIHSLNLFITSKNDEIQEILFNLFF